MKLGKHNLKVKNITKIGAYLTDGKEDIFLPRHDDEELKVGEFLDVFIYDNSNGNRVASKKMPLLQVGEVKKLTVVSKTKYGYFVDIGLDKDAFLPYKETPGRINENEEYLMMLYIDTSDRLCVTTKIGDKLLKNNDRFKVNDFVKGTIYSKSDKGAYVAIEDKYDGMILQEELKGVYKIGDVVEARVQRILRDGKITLTLREKAYKQMHYDAELLMELLEDNDGVLNLGDKSDPELIKEVTGLSKAAFKRAEGALYKERLVELYPEKIVLKKK
ncbi:S1 RNA-binding domain-containing protein [Anaerosphaera multitolerans]|uniref:S1 RNA-binding domain-containing protein n=1 Tax=Anaerosphaera multitolerans TaxID=2487351 RepID=A0A437S6C1_9FIRM|nr:S1-like domain-containing RNA-binding protein [Anaerosphaera multitolerans]RVU54536.1 S1 RNA-binding domain-containing protein [Anaerosphaera multitolerans]